MLKQQFKRKHILLYTGFALLLFAMACSSPKKFTYFNDLPKDSTLITLPTLSWPDNFIQRDDILEIKIAGKNEITDADFNKKSGGYGNGDVIPQYLVDKDGNIDLYLVGKIKVEGLSVQNAKEKITKIIAPYLLEPIVNVRLLNFRFTVLGDVKSPGSFSVNHEKLSVLEALGFAGDMTDYSIRNNVKVYRDSAGVRQMGILDFNSKKVLNSPFFYLKRNDVVYVESNTRKRQTNDVYSRAALLTSSISALVAILVFLKQ